MCLFLRILWQSHFFCELCTIKGADPRGGSTVTPVPIFLSSTLFAQNAKMEGNANSFWEYKNWTRWRVVSRHELRNIFAIRSTIIIYLNDWRMERENVKLVNRTLTSETSEDVFSRCSGFISSSLSAIHPEVEEHRRENVEKISKSDTRRYITL